MCILKMKHRIGAKLSNSLFLRAVEKVENGCKSMGWSNTGVWQLPWKPRHGNLAAGKPLWWQKWLIWAILGT